MANPVSLIAGGAWAASDADTFTSGTGDSTGHTILIVPLAEGNAITSGTISDNKGNGTYTEAVQNGGVAGKAASIHYVAAPVVGTGHTWTATGTDFFGAIIPIGWADATTVSPLGPTNSGNQVFASTVQTGEVTPPVDGCLIIACVCRDATAEVPSIDSGFTILDTVVNTDFGHQGLSVAYLVQGTAAAVNPTFTYSGAATLSAAIAVFKPGAAAAPEYVQPVRKLFVPGFAPLSRFKAVSLGVTAVAVQNLQTLSGAITPAGSVVEAVANNVGGGLTPSGSVVEAVAKIASGGLTPSAAAQQLVAILRGGTITPSSTLSQLKTQFRTLTGALTPTGQPVEAAATIRGGSMTPAGSAIEAVFKNLSGGLTPSGALSAIRAFLQSLSGTITPTGATREAVSISRGGGLTPTGQPVEAVAKNLAGGLTPSATLAAIRAFLQSLTGSLSPTGSIRQAAAKNAAGALGPQGSEQQSTSKGLAGSLTPTGALAKALALVRDFAGALTPSGSVAKAAGKVTGGTIAPTSTITRAVAKVLAGLLGPAGSITQSGGQVDEAGSTSVRMRRAGSSSTVQSPKGRLRLRRPGSSTEFKGGHS